MADNIDLPGIAGLFSHLIDVFAQLVGDNFDPGILESGVIEDPGRDQFVPEPGNQAVPDPGMALPTMYEDRRAPIGIHHPYTFSPAKIVVTDFTKMVPGTSTRQVQSIQDSYHPGISCMPSFENPLWHRRMIAGFLTWIIPFLVAVPFYSPGGSLAIDPALFKSIMIVVATLAASLLMIWFFCVVSGSLAREVIITGMIWLIMNWALDLIVIIGMLGMPVADYIPQIGGVTW
jgi:hypothetical protein